MTAQRTDEEESTQPVGQDGPGGDVAQDSTDLIVARQDGAPSAAAAPADRVEAADAAVAPSDGPAFGPAGQGEGAGGPQLGDASALGDRADAAVDALTDPVAPAPPAPEAAAAPPPDGSAPALEAQAQQAPPQPDATDGAVPASAPAVAMTAPIAPPAVPDASQDAPTTADEAPPAAAAAAETPDVVAAAPVAAPDSARATDDGMDGEDSTADLPVGEVAPDELDAAPAAEESSAPVPDTRPEPTTMEELLNEQSGDIRSFKHGDVVEGSVVRIDKDEILVDIGAKSEGVVSNRELYGRHGEAQPQLSIGDVVLVYVLQPESNEGHAVLSLRRAGLERKWRSMQEQFDAGVIIEAPVIDHNKGGLIVDCGIRGFVPISQIVDFPRRPQNEQPRDAAQEIAEKLQPFVGRKLRLKILEVNRKANRLILSEKVALYEERREKRDELFSSLQVGQKVTGSVRSIAPFGVFVDLGGIDGLVHKSELSWNKVNNPEGGYKVGEEVEAEVIDINHERGRISLSIRRLQPDPWHSTVADLKVGDLIDGTVTKIVNFGAFVRVRDGLEGLIHISELSHQRVAHPGDVVHEGQTLKLKIISLDSERHRLGLSLKQAEEAPARPMPEPRGSGGGGGGSERRGPRSERSFDASQAVQEPEGGIDNTLAAAFAQVRQQVAQSERARTAADDEVAAEHSADLMVEQPADRMVAAPETADAPAIEVDVASGAPTATDVMSEAAAGETGAAETAVADGAETPVADEPPPAGPVVADEPPSHEAGIAEELPSQEATVAEAPAPDDQALDAPSAASASLDQGAAADAAPTPDETGTDAGSTAPSDATAGESTGGDEPAEGAPDAAPTEGADREG